MGGRKAENLQFSIGGGEGGYTLVVFVMAIAVISIMMGVAVQSVSFAMQREREAELIFRGQQYVEAIRLYRLKYGRYPMRLKEIWEADPRVIRKKWKDPITDSYDWDLIFLGQEGGPIGTQGRSPGAMNQPTGTPTAGGTANRGIPGTGSSGSSRGGRGDGSSRTVGRGPDGEKVGPIVGVRSTSCEDSIKVYEGRTRYCDWRFVFQEVQRQGQGGGQQQRPTPEDDGLPYGTPRRPGEKPGPPGRNPPQNQMTPTPYD